MFAQIRKKGIHTAVATSYNYFEDHFSHFWGVFLHFCWYYPGQPLKLLGSINKLWGFFIKLKNRNKSACKVKLALLYSCKKTGCLSTISSITLDHGVTMPWPSSCFCTRQSGSTGPSTTISWGAAIMPCSTWGGALMMQHDGI